MSSELFHSSNRYHWFFAIPYEHIQKQTGLETLECKIFLQIFFSLLKVVTYVVDPLLDDDAFALLKSTNPNYNHTSSR